MIGKILGHYQVGEQLGRGGMGEVYLADDLNLNRKVALKFLPDAFAADPERMARFEREAKLLASLNHPNIAAIYGLEQAEGKRFIVLELVEGETLAQRISKGALPVEESLAICRQIAEGLEAAHEKGVVHRDLKGSNVMITAGDQVKILDFGLAKALSDETQAVNSSQSPTLTEAMTRPGVILGTAAYMSPEQAKGKAVDKRADIWAFGCILYECLTGKRAFEGETVTETLASVLTKDPEWEKVPAKIRPLLRRCLERDPKKRLRDIGDAMPLLEGLPESVPAKRSWFNWSVATLLCLALAAITLIHFREKPPAQAEPIRFQIAPSVSLASGGSFAVSPDGRRLVFAGMDSDGVIRLWMRALDSLETRPLPGTESPNIPPFLWSPDSRYIAFDAGGKLKKIDIAGGPALEICDLSSFAAGGSWNQAGVIIFGTNLSGRGVLKRVSAAGGVASPLIKLDPARYATAQYHPTFLPDGRHFLYLQGSDIQENRGVYVGSLDSKPEEQGFKRLGLATLFGPLWVPSQDSGPGQILFLREQALMSQRFDDKRLELIGEPVPVAERVGSLAFYGYFSASTNGVLVYRSGGGQLTRAMRFDRQGKSLGTAGESTAYSGIALSPDGTRVAASLVKIGQALTSTDLWLLDFVRGTNTRFTFGQGGNILPVWSPDGSRVIFASSRGGETFNLYEKISSGVKEEKLLLKSSDSKYPTSWSNDGRFLLYTTVDPKTKDDLWVLPLGGDRKPLPFLRTEFNELDGRFSPDMRWVAYVSDESGSNEIYIRGFSPTPGESSEPGGKLQVSQGGGTEPRWRRDGKELYYRAPDGKVMAVKVAAGTVFQSGPPASLFQPPPAGISTLAIPLSTWDVTSDGNRFLLPTLASESTQTPFTVVLNWQAGIKK